jgi:hypothetical protein
MRDVFGRTGRVLNLGEKEAEGSGGSLAGFRQLQHAHHVTSLRNCPERGNGVWSALLWRLRRLTTCSYQVLSQPNHHNGFVQAGLDLFSPYHLVTWILHFVHGTVAALPSSDPFSICHGLIVQRAPDSPYDFEFGCRVWDNDERCARVLSKHTRLLTKCVVPYFVTRLPNMQSFSR